MTLERNVMAFESEVTENCIQKERDKRIKGENLPFLSFGRLRSEKGCFETKRQNSIVDKKKAITVDGRFLFSYFLLSSLAVNVRISNTENLYFSENGRYFLRNFWNHTMNYDMKTMHLINPVMETYIHREKMESQDVCVWIEKECFLRIKYFPCQITKSIRILFLYRIFSHFMRKCFGHKFFLGGWYQRW